MRQIRRPSGREAGRSPQRGAARAGRSPYAFCVPRSAEGERAGRSPYALCVARWAGAARARCRGGGHEGGGGRVLPWRPGQAVRDAGAAAAAARRAARPAALLRRLPGRAQRGGPALHGGAGQVSPHAELLSVSAARPGPARPGPTRPDPAQPGPAAAAVVSPQVLLRREEGPGPHRLHRRQPRGFQPPAGAALRRLGGA